MTCHPRATWRTLWPLALLLAYGVAFASWALGASPIGFDDHPGQLYRAWHVVTRGPAPWAWNPGWWTGYPELQFYPPGTAYAVALVHVVTRMPLAATYQAFVWLAYLAPGVTAWLLLRRVLGDGWLALPGAFVALTLSAGLASGVEGGVHVGMVPARLAWALLPLLALPLVRWIGSGRGMPWTVAPIVAAIALTHPAHLPAAVVLVLVAGWLARLHGAQPAGRPPARARAGITTHEGWPARPGSVGQAALALGLAGGLTAFWTLPLLARVEHTRALAWGALSSREIFVQPLAAVLVALAGIDLVDSLRRREGEPVRPGLLAWFAWLAAAVVVVDALVIEPSGIRWLPADRVVDSAWLAFVLSAGTVVGGLIAQLAGERAGARPVLALTAIALTIGVDLVTTRPLTLLPPLLGWERAPTIERGLRLDALWDVLRSAPPGRVLFVRSGVPLTYGRGWWRPHSHITALTPRASGRDIVNGTFTYPSPVAALVYRGDAGPGAIRELVERLDGRRLFGRDLDDLDAATLNAYAERLAVSTIVALDEDVPRLRALRDNPRFTRATDSPPFVIYVARSGALLPTLIAPNHLRLPAAATAEPWRSTRIAYYPLWHAAANGKPLPTRRGETADLQVQSPGQDIDIDLVYSPGRVEFAGLALTGLSALALAAATVRRKSERPIE